MAVIRFIAIMIAIAMNIGTLQSKSQECDKDNMAYFLCIITTNDDQISPNFAEILKCLKKLKQRCLKEPIKIKKINDGIAEHLKRQRECPGLGLGMDYNQQLETCVSKFPKLVTDPSASNDQKVQACNLFRSERDNIKVCVKILKERCRAKSNFLAKINNNLKDADGKYVTLCRKYV